MALNELQFMSGIKDGEYIYASALYFNALFRININNGETHYIGNFGNGKVDEAVNHTNAIRIGKKIYFFPEAALGIDVYDLTTKEFSRIDLPFIEKQGGYKGVQVGKFVFMIPVIGGKDILKLDLETDEVTIALKFEEYKDVFDDNVKGKVTFLESTSHNGMLYLCCYETSRIITIDTTNNMNVKRFDLNCESLYGCFGGKKGIWILELKQPIIHLIDFATCEIVSTIRIHEQDCMYAEFNAVLELNDEIYVFPSLGNCVYTCKNRYVNKLIDIRKVKSFGHIKLNKIRYCINENNEIWILPRGTKNMMHIVEDKVDEVPLVYSKDAENIIDDAIKQGFDNHYKYVLLQEDEKLSLEQFVRCI